MPIFEYKCNSCGKVFEFLTFNKNSDKIKCPDCNSLENERILSTFNGIVNSNSKNLCPSQQNCEAIGAPCCGGKCPMN
jgi:putative FmdB family regulatory protein